MATNDLFWNEKATTFSNAFSNQDNSQQQYCNLNINAIHQSSAAKIDDPLQSKNNSFKNDERKVYDYKKTGKSIMKASQAVATNAEKKGKLIDDIAETEAKRRKVQLEKEETQLQREKLELIKVQLEIEALKKQQQRQ